ncbi:MAG: hypothetical protein AB7P07_09030 [Hyphomonadaceae bacterium]
MTKPANDTQAPAMLGLMPFPALNPFNWGMITPRVMLATNLAMLRVSLAMWRAYSDAATALIRTQDDEWFEAAEAALNDERAADGKDKRAA